jgi:hypothetical protein
MYGATDPLRSLWYLRNKLDVVNFFLVFLKNIHINHTFIPVTPKTNEREKSFHFFLDIFS